MKKSNFIIVQIIIGLICTTLNAQTEFFDDFNYNDSDDPLIENFGWDVLNGPNWPGQNGPVPYLKENVNFIENSSFSGDRILTLSTQTTNQLDDRSFSRIEYGEYIFLEGLYAARVHFDNAPANSDDGNVETFYTIFNAPSGDPEHAECDFEYLPYNIWGGGNTTNTLYATTWESYILSPWQPTNASTGQQEDFSDDWKLLLFTVMDDEVTYYVDGELFATHIVDDQDGTSSVYPDNEMQIAFANWIWSNNALPLGPSPDWRITTMQVDWVYHLKGATITQEEVLAKVETFRTNEVLRKNTMDGTSSLAYKNSLKTTFDVFPNPGLGASLMLITDSKKPITTRVEIKNTNGLLVYENEWNTEINSDYSIDQNDWAKGLYFIILTTGEKQQILKWILE